MFTVRNVSICEILLFHKKVDEGESAKERHAFTFRSYLEWEGLLELLRLRDLEVGGDRVNLGKNQKLLANALCIQSSGV